MKRGLSLRISLIVLAALLFVNFAYAEECSDVVDIHAFVGTGCPFCAAFEEFMDGYIQDHPNVHLHLYDVRQTQEARDMYFKFADAYNADSQHIPMIYIGNKVFVGWSESIKDDAVSQIESCTLSPCINPLEKADSTVISNGNKVPVDPDKGLKDSITVGAVLGAAAVDAINPCAFAVLIILMSTILATGNRKRALFAGLAFTLSIYISYFLMGLGLYSAIAASGLTHVFFAVVAVLAIVVGLFNLKDYFWYGKWFIMEVPLTWRPKMKALLRSVTSVPGAFFMGFVVSLFLLPCTSGPYIVILGLLAKAASRNYAMLLLLVYNFVFVIPMLAITGAIYFGFTTTESAERWRSRRLKVLHLISGLIVLLLGVGMLLALWFGWM